MTKVGLITIGQAPRSDTGDFPKLRARRPFLDPQPLLLGLLRATVFPGRLGVLTPSERHVPQTIAR